MFGFLVIGGYALSRLTGILSSDAVITLRENRTMARQLAQLTQHVILIGFGPIGELVARRLRDAGDSVVIIERADDLAGQASELNYPVVLGDAGADDAVFDRAGVERAKALVVTTEDPDRGVAITLMAHARNPALKIAVIGANRQRGALLRRAGASEVVIADDIIAGALVSRLGEEKKA
jgi:voltage-gated potassium channel Kch